MEKELRHLLRCYLFTILFAVSVNLVYWHFYGASEYKSIQREIQRERESEKKCGRPGTSDLFPDLRPCGED